MPNLTKVSYQIQHNSWIKYMKDQMLLLVAAQEEMSFANVLPPTWQVLIVLQIVLKKLIRKKLPLITLDVFALEQRTVLNLKMLLVTNVTQTIILQKTVKINVTHQNSTLFYLMTPANNVEKKNISKLITKHVPLVQKALFKIQLEKLVNVQRIPISMLTQHVHPLMFAKMGLYLKENVPQCAQVHNISRLMLAKIVLMLPKEEFQKMLKKLVVNVPLLMIKLLLLMAQRIAHAKPTRKLV